MNFIGTQFKLERPGEEDIEFFVAYKRRGKYLVFDTRRLWWSMSCDGLQKAVHHQVVSVLWRP